MIAKIFNSLFSPPAINPGELYDKLYFSLKGWSMPFKHAKGKEKKMNHDLSNCIIYDIEIINPVKPKKDADRISGINYAASWIDFIGMGIAVICCYDYMTERYRVFEQDNLNEFGKLIIDRELIGYNNFAFDDNLLTANNLPKPKTYDLLSAIWVAKGIGPKYSYPGSVGTSLDQMCKVNFGLQKPEGMDGLTAAIRWQQGKRGQVVDYCLNDVYMTKRLLEESMNNVLALPGGGHLDVNCFIPAVDQAFYQVDEECPF